MPAVTAPKSVLTKCREGMSARCPGTEDMAEVEPSSTATSLSGLWRAALSKAHSADGWKRSREESASRKKTACCSREEDAREDSWFRSKLGMGVGVELLVPTCIGSMIFFKQR